MSDVRAAELPAGAVVRSALIGLQATKQQAGSGQAVWDVPGVGLFDDVEIDGWLAFGGEIVNVPFRPAAGARA